jgi:hypothetical protein
MNDFLSMDVPYIWVVDYETRHAYVAAPDEGLREVRDGVLRTDNPRFEFSLSELS